MTFIFGMLFGFVSGGGGIVTTDLTHNVTAVQTYLPVETTQDFYTEDMIQIADERIYYTSTNATAFLGCTRGYDGTTAAPHEVGRRVFSSRAAALNDAVGFNVIAVQDTLGWASFLAIPLAFLFVTLPHIMRAGTDLLTGNLSIIVWFWYLFVGAFIIYLGLTIMGARRTA